MFTFPPKKSCSTSPYPSLNLGISLKKCVGLMAWTSTS